MAERIALHPRLKVGREPDDVRVHAQVPDKPDVPDAWPRLWPALSRPVDELPGLTVVLDHLGKPPLALEAQGQSTPTDAFARWRRSLVRLAEHRR